MYTVLKQIFPLFPEGIYEISGYVHVQIEVPVARYVGSMREACKQVRTVRAFAKREQMKDVMAGLNLMQDRCDEMVAVVQERIHAMGVEHDWNRLYPNGDDPFKPLKPDRMPTPEARKQAAYETSTQQPEEKSTVKSSTTETTWSYRSVHELPVHTLHRIGTTAMHPRLEYHASHGVWTVPDFFDQEYRDEMQRHAVEGEVCTILDVFRTPPAVTSEAEMNCDILYLAELMEGSKYYNPVFIPTQVLDEFRHTGSLDLLRRVYMSHDATSLLAPREKRQVMIGAALGAGVLVKSAVDKVLGWFGYHTTTGEELHRINSNVKHIDTVTSHVGAIERVAKRIQKTTSHIEHLEKVQEYLFHLDMLLDAVYARYEKILRGLELLHLHENVSPQLVEPQKFYAEVEKIRTKVQSKDEVLMVTQPADLWECPASYVIRKDLQVTVMVHIPVAKRASFKYLYRYEPTPMSSPGFDHHILAYPTKTVLSIDRTTHTARPMSDVSLKMCTRIGRGPKYCPAPTFVVKQVHSSCLTSLYGNDFSSIMRQCPVVYMEDDYVHVAALSSYHFSVYLPKDVLGRVTCGEDYLGSQKLMAGLLEISVNPMCRFTAPEVELSPALDLSLRELRFDKIALDLEPLENLTEPVDWAVKNAKIPTDIKDAGPSLTDIAKSWDHTMLKEQETWSFMTWAAVIVGTILGLIILMVIGRCLVDIYIRRQDQAEMHSNIREHVREVAGEEMRELMPRMPGAPSAPAQ